MKLRELLVKSLCFAGISTENSTELLRFLSDMLYKKGYVKKEYGEKVIEREKIYPTGLPTAGYRVAMPHADSEYVDTSAISIATLEKHVYFNSMGKPDETLPVSVVFLLAIKEKEKQVEAISQLIENILWDEKLIEEIVNSTSGDEIFELVKEKLSLAK